MFNTCLSRHFGAIVLFVHPFMEHESRYCRWWHMISRKTAFFSFRPVLAGGCSILIAFVILCSPSYAFKQEDVDKLLAEKQCAFCDLRNAELAEKDLSGARLSGARLSGANLTRANLSGANLRNTNCVRTNLSGVNLSGADLSGANLSGAQASNVNFSGAKFGGANLSKANLAGSDLTGADLSRTNLTEADLSWVKLRGANLSNARWIDNTRCKDGSEGSCEKEPDRPLGAF